VHRYRGGVVPAAHDDPDAHQLTAACERAPELVRTALDGYDFRAATAAVWNIVDAANRYIEQSAPWHLAKVENEGARLDVVLATVVRACRCLAVQLAPFVPATAARVESQCGTGVLPTAEPVFARIS
jgi:methionyl-tRNA synthetase